MLAASKHHLILNYNFAPNPLRESAFSHLLLIFHAAQILSLNGFVNPGSTKSVLRSWLEVIRITRFSTWSSLNIQPIFPVMLVVIFGTVVILGLYIILFNKRQQRTTICIFKILVTLCEFVFFVPALDLLFRSYLPQVVVSPGDFGLRIAMTSVGNYRSLWLVYVALTAVTFVVFIQFFCLIEYPFKTIFQDKLAISHAYLNRFKMCLLLAVSVVAWRIEEYGLPVIYLDVFACLLGLYKILSNITWNSFRHPQSHLLHGFLSAFFLSHTICIAVINSLPDDGSYAGIMDAAYFFSGVLSIRIYYNFHQKIFYTPSQTFSYIWKSFHFSQIVEKHTILGLMQAKIEGKDFVTEGVLYLQDHFASCNKSDTCDCLQLKLIDKSQSLGAEISRGPNAANFENLLVRQLILMLTTPGTRDYGNLDLLLRIMNFVAYQLENPVRACLILPKVASCMKLDRLNLTFYDTLVADLHNMISEGISETEKTRYEENFKQGVIFQDKLRQLRTQEADIRKLHLEFFTYLHNSNIVHLEELKKKGTTLIRLIDDLQNTLDTLLELNADSIELIDIIINFNKDFSTYGRHSLSSLLFRLRNIHQKFSINIALDKDLAQREFVRYDNTNIFLLIDVVENSLGNITQASTNFFEKFGYHKDNLRSKNSIHFSELIPPKASEAHRDILKKFRENSDTLFGTHDFGEVYYCLTRSRLLIPMQISVKIEIHGSQIVCAVMLRPERVAKKVILADEQGRIVSYTENLASFMDGAQEFMKKEPLNICMIMPAMIPLIHDQSSKLSRDSSVEVETYMFLCYKEQQQIMRSDSDLWDSFKRVSKGFADAEDVKDFSPDLRRILSVMAINTDQVFAVKTAIKLVNYESIGVSY